MCITETGFQHLPLKPWTSCLLIFLESLRRHMDLCELKLTLCYGTDSNEQSMIRINASIVQRLFTVSSRGSRWCWTLIARNWSWLAGKLIEADWFVYSSFWTCLSVGVVMHSSIFGLRETLALAGCIHWCIASNWRHGTHSSIFRALAFVSLTS